MKYRVQHLSITEDGTPGESINPGDVLEEDDAPAGIVKLLVSGVVTKVDIYLVGNELIARWTEVREDDEED